MIYFCCVIVCTLDQTGQQGGTDGSTGLALISIRTNHGVCGIHVCFKILTQVPKTLYMLTKHGDTSSFCETEVQTGAGFAQTVINSFHMILNSNFFIIFCCSRPFLWPPKGTNTQHRFSTLHSPPPHQKVIQPKITAIKGCITQDDTYQRLYNQR